MQSAVDQQVRGIVDIGRGERVVGAFDDQDAVLAGAIDEDGRDAARLAFGDPNVAGADAFGAEVLNGGGAEEIVADARDHGDVGAAERRGDGLVRAFAAEAELKSAAEDGFARDGGIGR